MCGRGNGSCAGQWAQPGSGCARLRAAPRSCCGDTAGHRPCLPETLEFMHFYSLTTFANHKHIHMEPMVQAKPQRVYYFPLQKQSYANSKTIRKRQFFSFTPSASEMILACCIFLPLKRNDASSRSAEGCNEISMDPGCR